MSQYENDNAVSISCSNRNDSAVFQELENYLNNHPKTGYLVFEVSEDSPLKGIIPVANANITVSKKLDGSYFISKVITTNEDGKTEALALPTISAERSRMPQDGEVYATYSASVSAENYQPKTIVDIPIFEGITSIQPVSLISTIDYNNLKYKND